MYSVLLDDEQLLECLDGLERSHAVLLRRRSAERPGSEVRKVLESRVLFVEQLMSQLKGVQDATKS